MTFSLGSMSHRRPPRVLFRSAARNRNHGSLVLLLATPILFRERRKGGFSMKPVKPILAGLALLVLASQAHAEYRTVLVQVKQDKDKKASVTIYSDEKKDQQCAASVDEAVTVIGDMKGWGSTVGVYVT